MGRRARRWVDGYPPFFMLLQLILKIWLGPELQRLQDGRSDHFFLFFMAAAIGSRLLMSATSASTWDAVLAASSTWATSRTPLHTDVPLTFFRDSNTWCPFCHRVFFFMEQKRLRYTTERIHLGGDPREPPKSAEYLRDVAPRGNVPALRIRDSVVLESLDILRTLDREFPDDATAAKTAEDVDLEEHLVQSSGAFDVDCDAWLFNTDEAAEAALEAEARGKLTWLEGALGARPSGPFFLGAHVTVADASFVGFLTRLATNYKYFKSLDVTHPASGFPNLARWLAAIDETPGGRATKQEEFFEQRIYQAAPERRLAAEPCMVLHPRTRGVGEPLKYSPPLPPVAAELAAGGEAALEAAWRLAQRREPLARFLLRKRHEAGMPPPAQHWKTVARRAPEVAPPASAASAEEFERVEQQLLALASVLTGQCSPAEGAIAAGGSAALRSGVVADLGGLVGSPRDMTAAAAATLRAALREMLESDSPVTA